MRRKIKNRFQDKSLFFWAYLLAFVGLLLLFSASQGVFMRDGLFLRQCMWIVLATVAAVFIKRVDYRDFQKMAPVMYAAVLVFLVLVLFLGRGTGAARWIRLGWFNFQPSEFAKLITVITLAAYFAERDVKRLPVLGASLLIIGVPFLLILRQPDLGTAFIFILILFAMLYQAGGSKKHILLIFLAGLFASPALWLAMKPYQRARILTFIEPGRDPLGMGYNLIQSIITIGSGGLFGRGFLKGTQTKLAFLPEYHTDFIFCVLAEEFGFLGVIILLSIYFIFFRVILDTIISTRDRFAKLMGAGILVVFMSQAIINISMTMGLFPVVGIPLPFISYGGSSMLVSLLGVVLLVNIRENALMF